jgi:hypothetical protein
MSEVVAAIPNETPAIPRKFPVLAVSWLASAEKYGIEKTRNNRRLVHSIYPKYNQNQKLLD